jgi:hypothetical protein
LRELGVQLSMTSLELLHSCLMPVPGGGGHRYPHTFAYFRDPSFKSELPEDHRWIFDVDYAPPGSNLTHIEHYTVTKSEEVT